MLPPPPTSMIDHPSPVPVSHPFASLFLLFLFIFLFFSFSLVLFLSLSVLVLSSLAQPPILFQGLVSHVSPKVLPASLCLHLAAPEGCPPSSISELHSISQSLQLLALPQSGPLSHHVSPSLGLWPALSVFLKLPQDASAEVCCTG